MTKITETGNAYVVVERFEKGGFQLHTVVDSFEDGELFMKKVLRIKFEKIFEELDDLIMTDSNRFSGPRRFYQQIGHPSTDYLLLEEDEENKKLGFNFIIISSTYWDNKSILNH
jgi:hypothetical protein